MPFERHTQLVTREYGVGDHAASAQRGMVHQILLQAGKQFNVGLRGKDDQNLEGYFPDPTNN